jgi:hypothetical protein
MLRYEWPWFRKFGFVPMPEALIGWELRAIIIRQADYLDASTRETLRRVSEGIARGVRHAGQNYSKNERSGNAIP